MIDETRLHQRLREWQEQPAKITSGPVRVRANERTCSFEIEPADGRLTAIAVVNSMSPGRREQDAEADAHFIADAYNTHHETGLTPRQLAEQRAGLLEALEPFALIAEYDIGADESDGDDYRPMQRHNVAPRVTVGHLRQALAAIAKARGGAA